MVPVAVGRPVAPRYEEVRQLAGNENFAQAKSAREDEFYTLLSDVEKELRHYRKHFEGKTVLCNCDDPFESAFFKYFALNFNRLKIRKLIATCYDGSPIAGTQESFIEQLTGNNPERVEDGRGRQPYKAVVTQVRDVDGDGSVNMLDVAELLRSGENELERLKGNGDFRNEESLELLDEADIVVTNPPFSLFREFIATLIDHDKKFVIIGPNSGVKYKETFPLVRDGKMWLGYTTPKEFVVPREREDRENTYVREDGTIIAEFGNVYWYTNLDVRKRHEPMILFRRYDSKVYPRYTNFDGIDVGSVSDIPRDWPGNMGLPISFLEQHDPDQFEIIGLGEGDLAKEIGITRNHEGRTKLEYCAKDGSFKRPFARLVIRNKHPEDSR